MTYRKNGINPHLISVVTGQDIREIPESPTARHLPGKYAKMVTKALAHIPKHIPERRLKLTCAECGQRRGGERSPLAGKVPVYRVLSLPLLQFARGLEASGYFRHRAATFHHGRCAAVKNRKEK
ncbi:hypothetical protein Sgly_1066 [Syntrophobotulus glycolicus DSM 8271]|uniref:Uncharacterized protein n=1 Tax=Syntrophobotulus glycolicus (strain DSM 8271 / FlGlyR) TaxID=645991 RepID=F0STV3_SYNGF|nr:hypothetical protein [Syntrophobotulus glycolicus]ADY55393.1 hypothetical protein Sgly_1066 [Syntrophobotulus glycolicus DSM 8271]